MGQADINIRAVMEDSITPAVKTVQGSLNKLQENVRELGLNLRQTGREISSVGNKMTMLGTAITGPLLLAFKTAGEHSAIASRAIWEFQNVLTNLQVSMGESVTPIVKDFTHIVGNLVDKWKALTPEVRNHLVQSVFLIGQYTIIGGVIMVVAGHILTMTANLTLLSAAFIKFITWVKGASVVLLGLNIPMIAVVAAISGVIYAMLKWKAVSDTVMNGLQIAINTISLLWSGLKVSILGVLDAIANAIAKLLELAGHLPDKLGGAWFREASAGAKELADTLHNALLKETDNVAKKISNMQQLFDDIAVGKNGSWAQGVDNLKNKFTDLKAALEEVMGLLRGDKGASPGSAEPTGNFFTGFQLGIEQTIQQLRNWEQIGKKTFQSIVGYVEQLNDKIISGTMTAFAKMVVEGKNFGESMKQLFTDWAEFAIAEIGRILIKLLELKAIEIGLSWLGFHEGGEVMHSGGVVHAHSGLATDEVPIIAQRGEGILSRRGMTTLGGAPVLNALNNGKSLGRIDTRKVEIYSEAHVHIEGATFLNSDLPREVMDKIVDYVSTEIIHEVDRIR